MNKKTITLILMLLLAVLGVKADVIPSSYYSEPAAGDFYLYNVSQGKFLDRLSSNFPTLTSTPVKFTLAVDGTGYTIKYTSNPTYSLHTGYWNNQYLWVDAGNASSGYVWTFDAIGGLTKTYQLKRTKEETQNGITGTFYANGTNAATSPTDDCKWALITEANYYNCLASTASIPATYYSITPAAGTYYLYSPYSSCFLYPTSDHAGLQNTPASVTLVADGDNFDIQFGNGKYLKYDAIKEGNTWANGTSGEAWEFSSFHGADGLFFIKHVTANSYLYSKTTEAASWGGECWPTPETNNTRYAWALISEYDYNAYLAGGYTLDEATGYSAERDIEDVNVTVTKSMVKDVWNTFVVPFDMAIPSGWTVMEPTAFDGSTLTFGDASSIVAGKPYIVKPESAVTSFSATGVTLKKDLENTTVGDVTMTGTYEYIDAIDHNSQTSYVVGLKNGATSLYQVNSTVSLKPFRAYFTVSGNNPGARVAIRFDDDTTGINVLEEENANENTGMKDGKYLENGRIIIVKNGVKYSTNGQIAK